MACSLADDPCRSVAGPAIGAFAYHSYQNGNGTVPYLERAVFDKQWNDMFLRDYSNHGGLLRLVAPCDIELWLTETSSSMAPAPHGQVNGVATAVDMYVLTC